MISENTYHVGILAIALVGVSLLVLNDNSFQIKVLGYENKTQTVVDEYEHKIEKINNPYLDSGICNFIGEWDADGYPYPKHSGTIIPTYCYFLIDSDSCDYVFLINGTGWEKMDYCNIPSELEREGFIELAQHFTADGSRK